MGKFFNLESPLMAGLGKLADLIWLNILAFICCIPIITVGASMTALNYVALKMVRDEEGYVTKAFFKSFKQNFKQATIIWLIMLLAAAVIIGDMLIFIFSSIAFPAWIRIALIAVSAIAVFATMHVFPVLAKFDNTIANTFKNSFFMGILSLPKTILMMAIWAIPTLITIYAVQAFPVVIGLGISGPVFLSAMLYNKTFKRFEPEEESAGDGEWSLSGDEEPGEEEARQAEDIADSNEEEERMEDTRE